MSRPRLVLASASTGRRRLLEDAGLAFDVIVSGVDEDDVVGMAFEVAPALAARKARAVAERVDGDALVLGCDSVLDHGGRVLGKPADAAEAVERWRAMRGSWGRLHTGHHLVVRRGGATALEAAELDVTAVRFASPTDDEVAAYVATGEPLRCAGAFTLDGLGGPFVDRVEGSPSGVVGLSLPVLRRLLARAGTSVTDLWGPARS